MSHEIRLTVGGIDYIVKSDDNEAYVRAMGEEMNRALDSLSKSHPYLSTTMVAVMAGIQFLDESKKTSIELESIKAEMKSYIEDAACARLEAEEARREIDRLNRENRTLRDSSRLS